MIPVYIPNKRITVLSPPSVQKVAFVFNYRGLLTSSIEEQDNHDVKFVFQDYNNIMKFLSKKRIPAGVAGVSVLYAILSDNNKVQFSLIPTQYSTNTAQIPFVLEMNVKQQYIEELKAAVVNEIF